MQQKKQRVVVSEAEAEDEEEVDLEVEAAVAEEEAVEEDSRCGFRLKSNGIRFVDMDQEFEQSTMLGTKNETSTS
jgi:hypothetical protein